MIKHVAVIAGAFAVVSTPALADDSANGSKLPPKALPTMKDKQRAVDAAANASSRQSPESLGNRGPPRLEKKWDEMSPSEKGAAQKRWLLNSGDFGPPGGRPADPVSRDRGKADILAPQNPEGPKTRMP
jgi:hypothetical protein